MEKIDSQEEVLKEIALSAAIFHDIVERHVNADVDINKSECQCGFGYCKKTIPKGRPAIFVKNFDGKGKIALCDKDCADANEYAEMEFFGCADINNLPPIEHKRKKMRRSELIYGYHCRLDIQRQNGIDKIADLREAYQRVSEHE